MPKFKIGTTFTGKNGRLETVTDIHTTTNAAGEVVAVRYVCEHDFMGQRVEVRDVLETTIARATYFATTDKTAVQ